MQRHGTYRVVLLIFAALMIKSCVPDAPHDNPLDPESPAFTNSGEVAGRVTSFYEPYTGIPGALVQVGPYGIAAWTNAGGAYSIAGIPSGNVSMIVSGAGYMSDTVEASVLAGRTANVDVHLDALPVVSSCKVVTRKIDQWWPGPVYSAVASGAVTDPDGPGDVAAVTLKVDTAQFGMTYAAETQMYQATLNANVLPQGNLEWLVGKTLSVVARDKPGGTAAGMGFQITRIIQDAPVPIFPTALDTSAASPEFIWARPSLPFLYAYKLELFRLDLGLPSLIWSLSNISATVTQYRYPDRLSAGLFFWTISVVDEFGNLSRSKEASFLVTE